MPTQLINDKFDELFAGGLDIGQRVGPELETFDNGAMQEFDFATMWAHDRVGAFECHGLIRDHYLIVGAESSRLGYPVSDEIDDPDVPGGRMNHFEYGRLRWQLITGVSVEFDEILEAGPWIVVKLQDNVAPQLGSGESLSLSDFVDLLSPFLPAGSLDLLVGMGVDFEFTRAWEPVTPQELQSLVGRANAIAPGDPVNDEAFLRVIVPDFVDPQFVANLLNDLPAVVEMAYVASDPQLPTVVGTGNPHFPSLGYLKGPPIGVNALRAWQFGADGSGVSIIDIENGWFFAHEDLPTRIRLLEGRNSPNSHYHGTAVLGVIVANDDSVGVVGLAPAATCHTMSWFSTPSDPAQLAARIARACFELGDGDIIVVEAQLRGTIDGIADTAIPAETDPHVFRAIQLATQLGIVVVEAAGNGASNLDHYIGPSGRHVLDRNRPTEFAESNAIVVGAATPTLPRTRQAGSNFGSRVDCYSWGDNILAAGAMPVGGTVPVLTPSSYWPFNPGFGHTSGATAIIAGAAALVQDLAVRLPAGPGRLRSEQMRTLFRDPQIGVSTSDAATEPVGRQPDLAKIAARFGG